MELEYRFATADDIEYLIQTRLDMLRVVNMGVKNEDGEICYVIGVLKSIRKQLGKKDGDSIHVVITER